MLADRELEPRDDEGTAATELMARPEPITESKVESLTEAPWAFLEPTRLVFPNGATVIYNVTDITDGDVAFAGRSLGGSSILADEDVVDAMLAGEVVASSGIGELGQVELDRFLADSDVAVAGAISPYTEGFSGRAATPDLEVLFQLVHLYMTEPRVDPVAVDNVARTYGPLIEDPGSDPGLAGIVALYEERYGDEPRLQYLPSAEDFATLDAAGVERVWRDRFGDASDWVFAVLRRLRRGRARRSRPPVRRNLARDRSIRALGRRRVATAAGVVERTVEAGTGAQGALNVLYTVPVETIDPSDVAAAAVVTQLLSTRLTDDIREALGESYSPFATVAIYGDPDPVVETYVSVTGAPDRIGAIAQFVQDDVDALRADGPSQDEFDTAVEQVSRDIELFSDAQLIDEILEAEVNGVVDLQDFAEQDVALQELTIDDVRTFVAAYLPVDQFIEITVVPRRGGTRRHMETWPGSATRWAPHSTAAARTSRSSARPRSAWSCACSSDRGRDAHRAAGRRRLRLALLPAAGAARPAVRLSGPRRRTTRHPGQRANPNKLLLDPYAKATCGEIDWDPSLFSYTASAIPTRSTTTTPPRT